MYPVFTMNGEREYKAFSFSNIKAESKGRVRTGIAAVFGNVDSVGDRIKPGAFAKTITEGSSRVKHLWNHSWQHPPLAKIVELREVGRNELPESVLAKAPDATGGLLVKREYYNNELSNWILEAIDADDINEMSFAFDIMQSAEITETDADDPDTSRQIRELAELRLFDTSDVLWGANAATVAAGAKNGMPFGMTANIPLEVIAKQMLALCAGVKSGRVTVTDIDEPFIKLIQDSTAKLTSNGGTNTDTDTEQITDAETGMQAGAAVKSTPLELLKLRNHELAIRSALTIGT